MSLLVITWVLSFLVMAGIYWYGKNREVALVREESMPKDFTELMTREIHLLNKDFARLARDMRPHGARAVRAGLVAIKRGNDLIISRVYGRMSIQKGGASSFFLKQIAEQKETEKDLPKGL